MTGHEQALYRSALEYATQKHSGQMRIGGALYITHPVAVAQLLRESGYGLDYQITALFHDLLEDTDATEAEIAALSNNEVLVAVLLLTKRNGYDMQEYVGKIRENPMAKAVKAADRLHNLQCALDTTQEFKRRYILETVDWYMDFSQEIPRAVKILAQSLEKPLAELPFLYEPNLKWKMESEEPIMENEFTVERAMQASSAEALVVLARKNGIILPMENAQELYIALHGETGALSDEALDAVSGGQGAVTPIMCSLCGSAQVRIAWKGEFVYECMNTQCAHTWQLGQL